MKKQELSLEQKRLDADLWIIILVTMGVFVAFATMQKDIMAFIRDQTIPIVVRLLLNAAIQFGVAGLGITIVCILRKEKFTKFGLNRKNVIKAIIGTIICFTPVICFYVIVGRFQGYHPLKIVITEDVIASGIPFSIIGMAIIAIVWGFFEGFNYAVISEKINGRYPADNKWLDYGAISCGIICILFHPISFSLVGVVEMLTTFVAIYGMLLVKKRTGNAWGCVFAFCFIWNAI